MTDIVDRAVVVEEQKRVLLLNRHHQNREKPLIVGGVRVCLNCEEAVSQQRIESVDAVRCFTCQSFAEDKQKHFRS